MVHLLALPGSPRARPLRDVIARATSDAVALRNAGFDGLVVENFGDSPFFKDAVPQITVAAMTEAISAVMDVAGGLPVTVNVLRNDALAALAVAAAVGAAAIRVNIHSGARVTDQGLIEGRAAETIRTRAAWGADAVAVWADVDVKHSAPLGRPRPVVDEAVELIERGGAEAVIVSGSGTGAEVDPATLAAVVAAVAGHPVLVGSGATAAPVAALLAVAHGAIVGTATKVGGVTTAPVDPARASAIVAAANG